MRIRIQRLSLLCVLFALLFALSRSSLPTATAQQGSQRGLRTEIDIKTEDGQVIKLYDKSYALLIGVSEYTNGWPKLPGVRADIEAVRAALEKQGFQTVVVMNPTGAQLEEAYRSFIQQYGLGIENRLLFYFAGHGHTLRQSYGEDMGYIVPVDAPLPNSDIAGFRAKAMSMRQMEIYAYAIQSKHALFLFDSCFSGSLLFALSRAVPYNIGYKTALPVRQFITSGSADELVPDISRFREQLIAALAGEADSNHDGYVTGSELGDFLQDRVVNYTKGAQHPQYGKIRNPNLDKGDFVFALPKAPAPSAMAVRNKVEPPLWKGLQVDAYCKAKYGNAAAATFTQGDAYSWRCSVADLGGRRTAHPLDMNDACRAQHGSGFKAVVDNLKEVFSWHCVPN
jgi:hypothetical protein